MNVLVFDSPPCLATLVRSTLRPQGHRVSISSEPTEAELKLRRQIFDAVVIGPSGAPQELAAFLESELPNLPVILAGVEVAVPSAGQVVAVLPAPLSPKKLLSTFARLERVRLEQIHALPVEVAIDGLRVSCRLADLTPETMVLSGESDAFQNYFGGSPLWVEAIISGIPLEGTVSDVDGDGPGRVRRVGVRLQGEVARPILTNLLKS
jgi:hypothetical protein